MPTEKLATILADVVVNGPVEPDPNVWPYVKENTSPAITNHTLIIIVAAIFLASVTILGLIALYMHKKKHKTDEPTNAEQPNQ